MLLLTLLNAMEFFNEILTSGCSPDAIVYYNMISGFSQDGRTDGGSFVKEVGFRPDTEMDEAGLKPAIAYNTLVALYQQNWGFKVCPESPEKDDQGRCGGAHSCYIQLSDKCILLKWKCEWSYGDFQRHESCIQGGSTPNATTYNAIFKGLGEEKDLEKAFELTACFREPYPEVYQYERSNPTTPSDQ
ncbi:hypothetical protein D5086_005014 [Populus alba]|uniref:Uncharacterized protein n=1 Tax=Populus alba TaxID=43335 RepID=A0ACC4CS60_POPAL